MAMVAWVLAPHFARPAGDGPGLTKWLIGGLTGGLVWQGVLVMLLVRSERGNLRWSTLKDALWLHAPTDPRSGGKRARLWLVCLPLIAGLWLAGALPEPAHSMWRDFGAFCQSEAGRAFFSRNWLWYSVVVVLVVFNTVLGEELLFRGLLLPRMNDAFRRTDWLVNGVLFALYHLHTPWVIPAGVLDAFWFSWPSKYFRCAWIGIVVHSTASVLILVLLLPVVMGPHG
ncbi:MAG: lysostaphin resistance A-like protein [Burkholderiales bacterium]